MKIGHKIALFYTTTAVSIITVIVIIFYFFTTRYINTLYYSYLVDKAYITAQKHWEKDEVDESSYQIIQKKYNELLPLAHEILLNADSISSDEDSLQLFLSADQIQKLFTKTKTTFKHGKQLGAALYYPDNEGNFIVIILSENHYGDNIIDHILILMIILIFFSIILIYLTGRIYSNRILAPLQNLLKELKRIRGNNLNIRLKRTDNNDELDTLIQTLNEMLDRIDTAFKSEKAFINNASHELNNPITAIQGECEISLMKKRSVEEYIAALQRIMTESKRISRLTQNLLSLSHQEEEMQMRPSELIFLGYWLKERFKNNDRIQLLLNEKCYDITVEANSELLEIALRNIIDNACKYSGNKTVQIRLFYDSSKKIIEITDHGIGIPQEEINHIFQSFYRASNAREYPGYGIGLSLSLKILSYYGGKVEISSELNKYTTFSIIFE